jgi:nickel-dependent lactate racemase
VETWLPYGHSEIPVRAPEERLVDILRPDDGNALPDPVVKATDLLKSSEPFVRKINGASRLCIVLGSCGGKQTTTELTKAVLQFINNPRESATIVCTEECAELDSAEVNGTRILRHTAKSDATECPKVNDGFAVQLNSEFVKADLRVLIGELRPHPFLGYSGLCDLVFPYLASDASISAHRAERPGATPNDLHMERLKIAKSFDNLFSLGLGLDTELRVSSMIFDALEASLASLEPMVTEAYSKQVTKKAEIVVMSAGGAPFDTTLARATESFPAGLEALKKDGALIVAAECEQGHGGHQFYEWTTERKEPRYLEARLRHHFSYDGFKAAFLGRIIQTHRVHLVSTIPDHYVEDVFNMKPAPTVNAALQSAQRVHGSDSTISIIPNASRVTPRLLEAPKEDH